MTSQNILDQSEGKRVLLLLLLLLRLLTSNTLLIYIGFITCLQIFGWYGKPLFGGWVGPEKGRFGFICCLLLDEKHQDNFQFILPLLGVFFMDEGCVWFIKYTGVLFQEFIFYFFFVDLRKC